MFLPYIRLLSFEWGGWGSVPHCRHLAEATLIRFGAVQVLPQKQNTSSSPISPNLIGECGNIELAAHVFVRSVQNPPDLVNEMRARG